MGRITEKGGGLMGNEQGYNGYKNRETWTVSLWADNDYDIYNFWCNRAEQLKNDAHRFDQVRRGIWTEQNAVLYKLADEIEASVVKGVPNECNVYVDLLGYALAGVDWQEVAESFTAELWEDEV
jgi:hypothetical protein